MASSSAIRKGSDLSGRNRSNALPKEQLAGDIFPDLQLTSTSSTKKCEHAHKVKTSMNRASSADGVTSTSDKASGAPLLNNERHDKSKFKLDDDDSNESINGDDWGEATPGNFVRTEENVSKGRVIISGILLILVLTSFTAQTEVTMYIHTLGWQKSWCMLYFVHSTLMIIWPIQLLVLRIEQRSLSWLIFWNKHRLYLRTTAQMIRHQSINVSHNQSAKSPVPYMVVITVAVTLVMTVGACPWFIAVNLTTASDLTAIYNCSAFFAYAFSILLLRERMNALKNSSVVLATGGIFIVAYGDKFLSHEVKEDMQAQRRALGNIVAGVGSILTGLHEVVYKKIASPPFGTSNSRMLIFSNTFASMIGLFTFLVLWIPLPILHYTGLEPFETPSAKVACLLFVSGLCAAVFSGSFMGLISLTSPVLSAVAILLTIFTVALVDWIRTGQSLTVATVGGSFLIMIAFLLLSWSTLREEQQKHETGDSLEMERMYINEET